MSTLQKRIFLSLTALVALGSLLGLVVINSATFKAKLKNEIISKLNQATGAKSSIGQIHVHLFPLRIVMTQLTVSGIGTEFDPPLLFVERIEVRPRIRTLFGKLQFASLDLFEPRVQLEVRSDGASNWPTAHSSFQGMSLLNLSAGRLRISGGILQFRERRIGLSTELDDFMLVADRSRRWGFYRAHLAYQTGKLQFGKNVWNHGLDLLLEVGGQELRVEKLAVSMDESRLEIEGIVKAAKFLQADLSYRGAIDPALLNPFSPQLRVGHGLVTFQGKFEYAGDRWRSSGTLQGKKLFLDTVKINEFSTHFSFDKERLYFDKVTVQGMHGLAEGDLAIESPFQSRRYAVNLKLERIGLLDLSLVARLNKLAFGGLLNGSIKARWRDEWEDFVGEGQLTIAEAPAEEQEHRAKTRILPLGGQLYFSLTSSNSSFKNSYLKLGRTRAEFAGVLSANQASNLRLQVKSDDLADIAFFIPGLQGSANFVGTLQGSLRKPSVNGSFVADRISYETFFFDSLSGKVEADRNAIHLSKTTATRAHSKLLADGTVFLGTGQSVPSGAVQLDLQVLEAQAEDLFALLGTTFPTSGLISGNFTARGRYPELEVQGIAQVRQGMFFDQPYDQGQFAIRFLDPVLALPNFSMTLGKGRIKGSADINLKEAFTRSSLAAHDVPLDRIRVLNSGNRPISGMLRDLQLKAVGNFRRPALDGSFSITDCRAAGELVGDLTAQFHTQEQLLGFALSGASSMKLKAEGTVSLNENYDVNATLTFEDFILSSYVKHLLPVVPETLNSQANGQISVAGPLRYPLKLTVDGVLNAMKITFRDTEVQSSKPFRFRYRDEKVSIKDALFSGKGTTLSIDGFVNAFGEQALGLEMKGDFDLALLNEFEKKLKSSGSGRIDASIRGTLKDPRVQGKAEVINGQFSYGDLPNSLSQVTANLFFDEDQIKINNFSGVSGGGQISMKGNIFFSQETMKLIQLQVEAREVRVRFPEGMRSVVDADLTLSGSRDAQLLSGNARLLSASFQKGYDPITAFLRNRKNGGVVIGTGETGSALSLDLNLTGDRAIKLDSPIMKATCSADLQIKGTALSPLMTGRIEADSGDVYFQSVRYRITRGRIDFVNLVRFEPRFDLEAEADVRDYRVILTLNGTMEKFRAELHSDPPLSNFDLFNLVSSGGAGGSPGTPGTRGSVSGWRPYSTSGTQQDSSLGAESVLSEGLSLQVGSKFKQIFGLDRFRVDPFMLGNERDQTARVTFGQQITKDVSVTYSAGFSSADQQVIIVEYNVNDTTSVIASRDAEGSLGVDVRFRKRLRQKRH